MSSFDPHPTGEQGMFAAAIIAFNQVQHLLYYQVRGESWPGRSD